MAADTLERITKLVSDTLCAEEAYSNASLSNKDMVMAINNGKSEGGSVGQHRVLDPIDETKGLASQVSFHTSSWTSSKFKLGICAFRFVRGDPYATALALHKESLCPRHHGTHDIIASPGSL